MAGPFGPASRNLGQVITYWAPTGARTAYATQVMTAPIKIAGRWMLDSIAVTKPDGTQIVSKAVVYVSQDVAVGGYLAEGDQTGTASPYDSVVAMEIQQFSAHPDLRFMGTNRKAFL